MIIYMEQQATAKRATADRVNGPDYGDEIMYSNWHPVVQSITREPTQAAASPDLPHDLSAADADAFLDRVYALATLI